MDRTTTQLAPPEIRTELPGFAGNYLRLCASHLAEIEDYIARQDLASISEIARVLRGNAMRMGLSELSSLGRELEEYCVGQDWSAIGSTFHAIADAIGKLCEGPSVSLEVRAQPAPSAREVPVETR